MTEIQHLSYSSVSCYLECARKWYYRYVEKIATPSAPALVFGSCFHSTIERLIVERAGGASDRDIDEMTVDIWSANWRRAVENTDVDWGDDLPENISEDGLRLLVAPAVQEAVKRLSPMIINDQPQIERRFELRVPGVPVPVLGFIDLITSDGMIRDMKTAGRAWTRQQAQQETQPAIYLAAANQLGIPHQAGRFCHVVVTKTKQPQVQFIETERKSAEILWILSMIQQVWRGIEAGYFPPNPKACWNWGRRCEFFERCRGKR